MTDKIIEYSGRQIHVPSDATDDEIGQILDQYDNANKGSKFQQYNPSESFLGKLFGKYAPDVVDWAAGATGTMRGAMNLVSPGSGSRTFPTSGPGLPYEANPNSGAYLAGEITDPAAATLGYGAGKLVQTVPMVTKAYKSAEAIRAARNVPLTVEQIARSAVAGGGAGAGAGYLVSEGDLESTAKGGMFGAGIGGALPVVGKGIQLGWGKAADMMFGKGGQVKAGQIARAAAGENLPQIRTAMENAPADLTAGQAAFGINQDPWQALGRLGETRDTASFYRQLMERQAQQRAGMLSGVTPDLAAAEANRTAQMTADMGVAKTAANRARIARETPFMPQIYQWVDSLGMVHQGIEPPVNAKGLKAVSGTQVTVKPQETVHVGTNAPNRTAITPEVDALGAPIQPTIIGTDSAGAPIYSTTGTRLSNVPSTTQRVSTVPEVRTTVGAQPAVGETPVGLIRQPKELPGIPGIEPLKVNPVFQALISDAKRMAKARTGLPAHLSRLTEDQIADIMKDPTKSLEGLQMMKAALDAKFSKTPLKDSALDAFDEEAITKIKKAMLGAVDTAIPEYGQARANFATNSAPVNQAKVLEGLRQKLVNPLDSGKDRAGVFTAALDRGEQSVLRQSGLNTRFNDSIESALTPQQFQTVSDISSALMNQQALNQQAKTGAGGLEIIMQDQAGKFRLPNLFNQKVALANKFLEVAEKYLTADSIKAISKGMQSGKTALEMLDTLPAAERNRAMMWIGQAGRIAPTVAGTTGELVSNKP